MMRNLLHSLVFAAVVSCCSITLLIAAGQQPATFTGTKFLRDYDPLGEPTIAYFCKYGSVPVPRRGRQTDIAAVE